MKKLIKLKYNEPSDFYNFAEHYDDQIKVTRLCNEQPASQLYVKKTGVAQNIHVYREWIYLRGRNL